MNANIIQLLQPSLDEDVATSPRTGKAEGDVPEGGFSALLATFQGFVAQDPMPTPPETSAAESDDADEAVVMSVADVGAEALAQVAATVSREAGTASLADAVPVEAEADVAETVSALAADLDPGSVTTDAPKASVAKAIEPAMVVPAGGGDDTMVASTSEAEVVSAEEQTVAIKSVSSPEPRGWPAPVAKDEAKVAAERVTAREAETFGTAATEPAPDATNEASSTPGSFRTVRADAWAARSAPQAVQGEAAINVTAKTTATGSSNGFMPDATRLTGTFGARRRSLSELDVQLRQSTSPEVAARDAGKAESKAAASVAVEDVTVEGTSSARASDGTAVRAPVFRKVFVSTAPVEADAPVPRTSTAKAALATATADVQGEGTVTQPEAEGPASAKAVQADAEATPVQKTEGEPVRVARVTSRAVSMEGDEASTLRGGQAPFGAEVSGSGKAAEAIVANRAPIEQPAAPAMARDAESGQTAIGSEATVKGAQVVGSATAETAASEKANADASGVQASETKTERVALTELKGSEKATPKVEGTETDTPRAAASKIEGAEVEAPKAATQKVGAERTESPNAEAPKTETPKVEARSAEVPRVETTASRTVARPAASVVPADRGAATVAAVPAKAVAAPEMGDVPESKVAVAASVPEMESKVDAVPARSTVEAATEAETPKSVRTTARPSVETGEDTVETAKPSSDAPRTVSAAASPKGEAPERQEQSLPEAEKVLATRVTPVRSNVESREDRATVSAREQAVGEQRPHAENAPIAPVSRTEGVTVRSADSTAPTAGASSPEAPASRVSVESLGEETVRQVKNLLGSGEQRVRIRLVPESLGELHVEVNSRKGEVSVRLVSASPVVREALEAQTPGLREALTRDGVNLSRVDVSANMAPDSGTGSSSMARDGGQQAYASRTRYQTAQTSQLDRGSSASAARPARAYASASGLDLLV